MAIRIYSCDMEGRFQFNLSCYEVDGRCMKNLGNCENMNYTGSSVNGIHFHYYGFLLLSIGIVNSGESIAKVNLILLLARVWFMNCH